MNAEHAILNETKLAAKENELHDSTDIKFKNMQN